MRKPTIALLCAASLAFAAAGTGWAADGAGGTGTGSGAGSAGQSGGTAGAGAPSGSPTDAGRGAGQTPGVGAPAGSADGRDTRSDRTGEMRRDGEADGIRDRDVTGEGGPGFERRRLLGEERQGG